MTLKEKLKWDDSSASRLQTLQRTQAKIESGKAQSVTYYFFTSDAFCYAVEMYLEGGATACGDAARLVVDATLLYFYGDWRGKLLTEDGKTGHEEWKKDCLWYDEVQRGLPFAVALSDWKSAKRIADYPAENPPYNPVREADAAKGEGAWGWALIMFLRDESREKVEDFLRRAESDKARRPKLLCPVLRALMEKDEAQFNKTFLAYLAYYRKSEFKLSVDKVMSLAGTTLYHLGRTKGFKVTLPENVADHILRFENESIAQAGLLRSQRSHKRKSINGYSQF